MMGMIMVSIRYMESIFYEEVMRYFILARQLRRHFQTGLNIIKNGGYQMKKKFKFILAGFMIQENIQRVTNGNHGNMILI